MVTDHRQIWMCEYAIRRRGLVVDRLADPRELPAVAYRNLLQGAEGDLDRWLHRLQQAQSVAGDPGDGVAAVAAGAVALHQALLLQTVDDARDVGSSVEHARGDVASRMPLGKDSPQDAQDVVLRDRDPMLSRGTLELFPDIVSGDDEVEECFLLRTLEAGLLDTALQSVTHDYVF